MRTLVRFPNLEGGTTLSRNMGSAVSIFDHFFNNVFDDFAFPATSRGNECKTHSPAVNVRETDKSFELDVAMPGLSKDDISVEVDNGTLTISGGTENEKNESNETYSLREYSACCFKRLFSLPENVKEGDVKGKYENGILTLILPKEDVVVNPSKQIKIS